MNLMDLKQKWEVAKKFKLSFRCLGEGHFGWSCFCSRTCGLDGCQEFHHRLLHQHTKKKTSGASSREGVLLHNKDTDSKAQQQKSMKSEQNQLFLTMVGRQQIRMAKLHLCQKHL